MRFVRCALTALFLAGVLVPVCRADTLTLKTGETVEGTIMERENEYVILRAASTETETLYTANEIADVNGEKFVIVRQKKAVSVKEPALLPAPVAALRKAVLPSGDAPDNTGSPWHKALARVPPVFLLYAGAAVLLYCLGVLFLLMHIAEKTKVGPAWHAWVPVANILLLCRIAGLPSVWLFAFLTGFIPVVGPYVNIAAVGYIWWRVACARQYPGWFGLLVLLVPLGIFPMAVLAFKDRRSAPPEKPSGEAPKEPVPGPTGVW